MNGALETTDLVFETYAHKLRLMRDRQAIVTGKVPVDEPEAAVWWLDKEIAEMEAGK